MAPVAKPLPATLKAPLPTARPRPMRLWGVEGEPFAQGIEFKGKGWTATLYDTSGYQLRPPHWLWELDFPRVADVRGARYYVSAHGARNALIRAVRRLNLRLPRGKGRRVGGVPRERGREP